MTCPRCMRPAATASAFVGDEGGLGRAWFGDRCFAAIDGRDYYCGTLAVHVQAVSDAALLADARCIPRRALAEMARVLRFGGEKHGAKACEPSSDQDVFDHAQHARAHIEAIESYEDKDADTGALHLIHAAARALLAAELVMAGEERR